ncbi:MAG TPA: alpha/beta fold hydrolase [Candidatus Dormibacteraeota bacterium]|nr:alpha/beta fold hydrolase [Candidatus Dormibacteraeota bacterium]
MSGGLSCRAADDHRFTDDDRRARLRHVLAHVRYGGADLGECQFAAQRAGRDRESWYSTWHELAERTRDRAERRLRAAGGPRAGEDLLRASTYYRAAELALPPCLMACGLESFRASRECFRRALDRFDRPAHAVEIPFQGESLPGYLLTARPDPAPTLVVIAGMDGTAEEGYFLTGAAALAHGYHCLVFDGPGQGAPLRDRRSTLRPDWESVIGPALDVLTTRPEVDPGRIVLVGQGLGGYLAARAASHDHRPAALVTDPGLVDLEAAIIARMGPELVERIVAEDPAVEQALRSSVRPEHRFSRERGLRSCGLATHREFLRTMLDFRLDPARIRCPTLVCDQATDVRLGNQARMLYEGLGGRKDYVLFAAEDGAEPEQHGLGRAVAGVVFDWLDEILSGGSRR